MSRIVSNLARCHSWVVKELRDGLEMVMALDLALALNLPVNVIVLVLVTVTVTVTAASFFALGLVH